MSYAYTEFKIRNAHTPSEPVRVSCGESMAKQSFKAECDINTILKKYDKNGIITHLNKYNGQYGDVTEAVDYQTALNTVMAAEEAFMSLPAEIRTRFKNDPHEFLQFANEPTNGEEMVKMGLAHERRPAPEPDEPDADTPAAEVPPV